MDNTPSRIEASPENSNKIKYRRLYFLKAIVLPILGCSKMYTDAMEQEKERDSLQAINKMTLWKKETGIKISNANATPFNP
jgi:hypothetical protein